MAVDDLIINKNITTRYSQNQPSDLFGSIFAGATPFGGIVSKRMPDPTATSGYREQPFVLIYEPGKTPVTYTENTLRERLLAAPPRERSVLQKQLTKMGVSLNTTNGKINPADNFEAKLFQALSGYTEAMLSQYNFSKAAKVPFKAQSFGEFVDSLGAGETSGGPTRSVQVTQFDAADSRSILEDFYEQALGRRPDEKEVTAFQKAINKAAKARPAVSTTNVSGNTSTTTQAPGFSGEDAGLMARQQAEAQVGSAGYRNSTVYYDAFLRAIGQQV